MRIGIVGHGSNKFTPETEAIAKRLIQKILSLTDSPNDETILISGHSPVGGIDIWSEEIAKELMIKIEIKTPIQHQWDAEYGYKQRNLDIARCSDEVHVILVKEYPKSYKGQRFATCYHCDKHPEMKSSHIKSGGCWTGWEAKKLGKSLIFHIISANSAPVPTGAL